MRKCDKCGKTDFDDAEGCSAYTTYSPAVGDWTCVASSKDMLNQMAWKSPETAPRDKTFIAHFEGYPWPLITVYSPAMEQFVVADVEASTYEGKDDLYFTTEWLGYGELLGWMAMPELPEVRRS